jgi:hypothetical protein
MQEGMADGSINGIALTLQLRREEDRTMSGGPNLREEDFRDAGRSRARRPQRRNNCMAHI